MNPLVLVSGLVENLSKILSNKKLTFGSYFLFSQSDMVSCPKPKLHGWSIPSQVPSSLP
jgi:hypothetical protein